jgi:hypothetical protein
MTADRWPRIKELFHAALEQAADDRPSFLQQACADDAEGRTEIERLLAAHLEASSFIEHSPLAGLLTSELLTPLTGRLWAITGSSISSASAGWASCTRRATASWSASSR